MGQFLNHACWTVEMCERQEEVRTVLYVYLRIDAGLRRSEQIFLPVEVAVCLYHLVGGYTKRASLVGAGVGRAKRHSGICGGGRVSPCLAYTALGLRRRSERGSNMLSLRVSRAENTRRVRVEDGGRGRGGGRLAGSEGCGGDVPIWNPKRRRVVERVWPWPDGSACHCHCQCRSYSCMLGLGWGRTSSFSSLCRRMGRYERVRRLDAAMPVGDIVRRLKTSEMVIFTDPDCHSHIRPRLPRICSSLFPLSLLGCHQCCNPGVPAQSGVGTSSPKTIPPPSRSVFLTSSSDLTLRNLSTTKSGLS